MTAREHASMRKDILIGPHTYGSVTHRVLALSDRRFRALGWAGLALSAMLAGVMIVSIAWVLIRGVGVWGVDIPTAWGFAITNFVWWIGIGHAGTLISAILLLVRQSWRNSINRFAEAMTLFAIMMAGLFPLLHLGRIHRFYYLFPYPNEMNMWPQWRSPLVWDVVAVLTYATVSLIFWYLGLLPDLASVRDFSRRRWARRLAGLFSLGWCGSVMQWRRHQILYFLLAALATPLVVSVHSIVSLDFSIALVPGWHATIFPPYFVAGAIFSGMAMVFTITIPLRRALRLHDLVTDQHLDAMAKIMLAAALIVAYGYLMELFNEWYSGSSHEATRLRHRFVGPGAPLFFIMLFCNVAAPQALWWRRVRRSALALFALSIVFNIGMWVERYDIVITSLAHNDYLASMWRSFSATIWDWALLAGSIGAFVFLFLVFVRWIPIIPAHEMKELVHARQEPLATEAHTERAAMPTAFEDRKADVWLLRFDSPEALLDAARLARSAGVAPLDAFSPFEVESLHEELRMRSSRLPWAVAIGALLCGAGAYFLQWYAATQSYPWNVGGRPFHSWPSFLPLTFELSVLGGSLAGFAALCIANRWPRPVHPFMQRATFGRASSDRFFLAISASEHGPEREARRELVMSLGAERVLGVELS